MFTVRTQEETDMSLEFRNTAIEPGQNFENALSVRQSEESTLPRGGLDEVGGRFALSVGCHKNRIISNTAIR